MSGFGESPSGMGWSLACLALRLSVNYSCGRMKSVGAWIILRTYSSVMGFGGGWKLLVPSFQACRICCDQCLGGARDLRGWAHSTMWQARATTWETGASASGVDNCGLAVSGFWLGRLISGSLRLCFRFCKFFFVDPFFLPLVSFFFSSALAGGERGIWGEWDNGVRGESDWGV